MYYKFTQCSNVNRWYCTEEGLVWFGAKPKANDYYYYYYYGPFETEVEAKEYWKAVQRALWKTK